MLDFCGWTRLSLSLHFASLVCHDLIGPSPIVTYTTATYNTFTWYTINTILKKPEDCLVGYPMPIVTSTANGEPCMIDTAPIPTKTTMFFGWLMNYFCTNSYTKELGFCPNLLPNYGVYSNTYGTIVYTPIVAFPSISLGFKMVTGNLGPSFSCGQWDFSTRIISAFGFGRGWDSFSVPRVFPKMFPIAPHFFISYAFAKVELSWI